MPAMNEDKTIGDIVSSVIQFGYQIIVVDDASGDNTASEAEKSGAIVLRNIQKLAQIQQQRKVR